MWGGDRMDVGGMDRWVEFWEMDLWVNEFELGDGRKEVIEMKRLE